MKLRTNLLLVSVAVTLGMIPNSFYDKGCVASSVRTVVYEEDVADKDLAEEFDSYETYSSDQGFTIMATKKYSASIFSDVDLVSDTDGEIEIEYELNYYEAQNLLALNLYQVDGDTKTVLFDTLEGLIVKNDDGEADVLFADETETVYLSELIERIDNVGILSDFLNFFVEAAEVVKDAIVSLCRETARVAVEVFGLQAGASMLDMSEEDGIYHADFNCWQSIFGYNDFYDAIFDLGTEMDKFKHDFYDKNDDGLTDFILWGWRGDYWELGAGAELGIYRRLGKSSLWYVDKNLAIDMTMRLDYRTNVESENWRTIIDWDPKASPNYPDKQWWITGFNPQYVDQIYDKRQLRATFTVKFDTIGYDSTFDTQLRNSFRRRWVEKEPVWTYTSSTGLFSYQFQ